MKEFGQYPIDACLEKIGDTLETGATCLIKAEPGAGKTTRVPLYLLSVIKGDILVLEPRRLAARLSAERSAWFLDEACGKKVGFRIRQDSKVSDETRLTFITEGLFVRLLRANPTLKGVGAVVLDEFHERNIHTDIALALTRRLQQTKRPDLKLIVMSATLDTASLEEYLEDAAVFDVEGRTFPVEVEHASELDSRWQMGTHWESQVVEAVNKMLVDPRCPGSILVFLTGMGQIMQTKRLLEKEIKTPNTAILPLAADLPFREQQRIFEKDSTRRIVLSTNVAETSLTIPGITGVIDLGLAKIPAHAPWSGMPTLEVKRISRASAIQRGGRAGRTEKGVVYRLYSKPEFVNREAFTSPDIQRIDISHAVLEVMNLGYSPELMPWFEPPDEKNLESAIQLLTYLGAIDNDGKLTAFGNQLSTLPIHPRLSAIALQGQETGCGEDALLAACLISEGFALKRNAISPSEEEEGDPCDLSVQMDLLKSVLHKKALSEYPLQFLDSRRQTRVLDLYRSLSRIFRLPNVPPPVKTNPRALSLCLLRGYPDRVAQRREVASSKKKRKGVSALYNFCLGRGGMVGKGSVVFNEKPKLLIAIDAVEDLKQDAARGITIRACSTLLPNTLYEDPGKLLKRKRREEFDPKSGAFTVWEDLGYGNLTVESKRVGVLEEGGNLAGPLAENWPYPFDSDEPLKIYHRRVELLTQYNIPHNCPVFAGEMLTLFFEFICEGVKSLKELTARPLEAYIHDQLSAPDRALLDAYAPMEIKLRNGRPLKIRYQEGKEPWGEMYIQDSYGLKETPRIMQGECPVVLHLLGPNRRAAQVTDDLARFWQGSYKDVLKELSRRYPKHHWSENPANAEPVRFKKALKA